NDVIAGRRPQAAALEHVVQLLHLLLVHLLADADEHQLARRATAGGDVPGVLPAELFDVVEVIDLAVGDVDADGPGGRAEGAVEEVLHRRQKLGLASPGGLARAWHAEGAGLALADVADLLDAAAVWIAGPVDEVDGARRREAGEVAGHRSGDGLDDVLAGA